ncbi:hypothetical protein PVAP13_6KG193336 [Panicum virgatum]|uniref:Uncharacterized protein n=1 Tax=Panicum virgatum TaxID=38727 RepID=A0A8T0RF80_PANVG|nr:hypothetical protein PVAP13_6KG193336 [Panicum virgatum]
MDEFTRGSAAETQAKSGRSLFNRCYVSVVKNSERVIAQQCTKAKEINSNPVLLSLSQQLTRHHPMRAWPQDQETTGERSRGDQETPTATPSNPLAIDPRFLAPFLWDSSDSLAVSPWFWPLAPTHKADGLAPPAAQRTRGEDGSRGDGRPPSSHRRRCPGSPRLAGPFL